MKYSTTNSGLFGSNPIANIFVVIIGTLAIAASIVLGFFAFLILTGVVLVMAAVIGLRVWWFKRNMQRNSPDVRTGTPQAPGGIIEGEFEVVADEDEGE